MGEDTRELAAAYLNPKALSQREGMLKSGAGSVMEGGDHGLPMDLCNNPPEWHTWIYRQVESIGSVKQNLERALRSYVAKRYGTEVLSTHDWAYTPGSGQMIDHLLRTVPGAQCGAVLPTYQRVVAVLTDNALATSVDVSPETWAVAEFVPPPRSPSMLVVNALHANPIASSLSASYLADVADYARSNSVVLVEDDPFRGLGCDDHRWPTLLSLHPHGTVYLGSWTKSLGWPVKLGLVGWPRNNPEVGCLRVSAPSPSAETLADLAAVLESGRDDVIRSRRHALLTERRIAVIALLKAIDWAFVPPTGGAHIALLTREDVQVRQLLAAERIGGLNAAHFYPGSGLTLSQPFVRLGLSNVNEGDWDSLLASLERVLRGVAAEFRQPGAGR